MEVIHDTSHVDEWMRGKRTEESLAAHAAAQAAINASRAAYARQLWKPLLAGAAGAALVIAAVYVALPKFIPHQIDFDHVVIHQKDVTVDHYVPKDVPFDRYVPRDVPFDHYVPHDTPAPRAEAPAPMSEGDFKKSPDWKSADLKGRIIGDNSQGGFDVTEEDGKVGHWGCLVQIDANNKTVRGPDGNGVCDTTLRDDTRGIVGNLAACYPNQDEPDIYKCGYLDPKDGVVKRIPIVHTSDATPALTPPAYGSPAGEPAPSSGAFPTETAFRDSFEWKHSWLRGRVKRTLNGELMIGDDSIASRTLNITGPEGRLAYCDQKGFCHVLEAGGVVKPFHLGSKL